MFSKSKDFFVGGGGLNYSAMIKIRKFTEVESYYQICIHCVSCINYSTNIYYNKYGKTTSFLVQGLNQHHMWHTPHSCPLMWNNSTVSVCLLWLWHFFSCKGTGLLFCWMTLTWLSWYFLMITLCILGRNTIKLLLYPSQ